LLEDLPVVAREYQAALTQLGSLGGGNHFIVCKFDEKCLGFQNRFRY